MHARPISTSSRLQELLPQLPLVENTLKDVLAVVTKSISALQASTNAKTPQVRHCVLARRGRDAF